MMTKNLKKYVMTVWTGLYAVETVKQKASELMVEMFDEIHDKQDEAREIANNMI